MLRQSAAEETRYMTPEEFSRVLPFQDDVGVLRTLRGILGQVSRRMSRLFGVNLPGGLEVVSYSDPKAFGYIERFGRIPADAFVYDGKIFLNLASDEVRDSVEDVIVHELAHRVYDERRGDLSFNIDSEDFADVVVKGLSRNPGQPFNVSTAPKQYSWFQQIMKDLGEGPSMLSSRIDKVANNLEARGMVVLAYELDKLSNTVDALFKAPGLVPGGQEFGDIVLDVGYDQGKRTFVLAISSKDGRDREEVVLPSDRAAVREIMEVVEQKAKDIQDVGKLAEAIQDMLPSGRAVMEPVGPGAPPQRLDLIPHLASMENVAAYERHLRMMKDPDLEFERRLMEHSMSRAPQDSEAQGYLDAINKELRSRGMATIDLPGSSSPTQPLVPQEALPKVASQLDRIASYLEEKGLTQEAFDLDIVANTVEASFMDIKMPKPREVRLIDFVGPRQHEAIQEALGPYFEEFKWYKTGVGGYGEIIIPGKKPGTKVQSEERAIEELIKSNFGSNENVSYTQDGVIWHITPWAISQEERQSWSEQRKRQAAFGQPLRSRRDYGGESSR